jgi:ribonucleotide reductase alpha subunit
MPDWPYDQLPMLGIDPLHGQQFVVRKRDGRLDEFNEARIYLAIESVFKAVAALGRDERLPDDAQSNVKHCADTVATRILSRAVKGEELEVEKIQDAVEEQLMLAGHVEAARRYILYREERRQARAIREQRLLSPWEPERSPKISPAKDLSRLDSNFSLVINEGQFLKRLAPEMLDYDLEELGRHLRPERDELLAGPVLQKLRDDYFLRDGGRLVEGPQSFWMRIAMGLALNEGGQAEARALEFYEVLSTLRFAPSDAILRHAGSPRPELAICHTVSSAGAVEHVMAMSGAACIWLEPWHSAIFDLLLPTQNGQSLSKGFWIPDLFLRRVQEQGPWTLFDPAETPALHELDGAAFEECYLHYEKMGKNGQLKFSRVVRADAVWRGIMDSIGEGEQTVVGFKDTVNSRAALPGSGSVRHAGLGDGLLGAGSVSGAIHLPDFLRGDAASPLDLPLLRATVATVIRMLDNALELSVYPSPADRETALANRVIGLGMHGWDDALQRAELIDGGSDAAELADRCAEALAWSAVLASSDLAAERGPCAGFFASKWREGVMPLDSLAELERQRGFGVALDRSTVMDWKMAQQAVLRHRMRHIAVTAWVADPAASLGPAGPEASIECAARRQKWIDLGQSFSFSCDEVTSQELSQWYLLAWRKGLKTVLPPVRVAKPAPAETLSAALNQQNAGINPFDAARGRA